MNANEYKSMFLFNKLLSRQGHNLSREMLKLGALIRMLLKRTVKNELFVHFFNYCHFLLNKLSQ